MVYSGAFAVLFSLCHLRFSETFTITTSFLHGSSAIVRRGAWQRAAAPSMSGVEEAKKLMEQAAKLRAEANDAENAMRTAKGLEPAPVATKAMATATVPSETATAAAVAPPAAPIATVVTTSTTPQELAAKIMGALSVEGAPARRAALDALKAKGVLGKWGSGSFGEAWSVSQGQLKSVAGIDGKAFDIDGGIDDLKYALGYVVAGSFVLAVASGTLIGGNVGATFTYGFAILPIVFLGIGSTSPGLIAAAIDVVKARSDPEYVSRRILHEAAHALVGWLAGVPVRTYKVDGPATQVEFFDTREGDQMDMNRKLTAAEVDTLSVVALAGAVAEVQKFGKATGAASDLDFLGRLMNRAEVFMPAKRQEEQTRWAALTAHKVLKEHRKELEAIEAAFREGRSVEECLAALESAR